MIDKNILDNLKGQEIKELIVDGKITLEDLDASALEKLFDYETDMLCIDEGDIELINACAERMDELNGPLMTEEHFWAVINKVDAEMVSDKKDTAPVDVPVNAPARVVKKRIIWKKVWLVAAIIALLISAATITASAFGFNVFDYFKEVIGLPVGEKVDKGTVTLINRGEVKEYSSIEELLSDESINILYPSSLPTNSQLESVKIVEDINGKQIIILTNNPQINIVVFSNQKQTNNSFADCEMYLYNDKTFYINKELNAAYFYFGDNFYSIQADSYENVILIIESLKEK
ncbi:MAG: hypothetical protein J6V56_06330 [Clostridia bacterium]|nr:hypothetical protein [Clostridia bacterium]